MALEWFDRVIGELQDNLESICEKYDQVGHMSVDRGAKHPRIEFFVETMEDERDYFCTLFYDPHNEEFYVESFDLDTEQTLRTILSDIEDVVDEVHESLHDYLNDDIDDEYELIDDEEFEYEEDTNNSDDYYYSYEVVPEDEYEEEYIGHDDELEEIEVNWTTPEITAYAEDDVEVSYQFGLIDETGDGILRRVNRIKTDHNGEIEDESNFIFSKEEASTIIAMIASHMDSMTSASDFQSY